MVNPKFIKALDLMKEIHDKKNRDYSAQGPYDNFEFVSQITQTEIDKVFLIQIANKVARLGSLLSKGDPNFESLQDTRMDLAVYAAMYFSYFLEEEA